MASENFSGQKNPRLHQQLECRCKCGGSGNGTSKLDEVLLILNQHLIQLTSSVDQIKSSLLDQIVSSIHHLLKSSIETQVKETFNQVIASYLQNSVLPSTTSPLPHQGESSASIKSFRLSFKGILPDELLTKNKIEDEGVSLEVELLDESGKRVETGIDSCVKVQIDVLDCDFDVDDKKDWTEDDFKRYVVSPRKDRESLLKGNKKFTLNGGVASVCDVSFTDNSKPIRNGKFRLGARVIECLPSGGVVRPAVSKAFKVKENRLKTDRKHPIPSPDDELWRLKNINKTGAYYRRLQEKNVNTVRDFLQLYHTDEKKMKAILGLPKKKWDETVKNAEACKLTPKRLRYYDDASGDDLILDCAFNIIAATFKGETRQLYESLGLTQKEKAGKLRQAAYEKRDELEIFDESINQVPAGLVYPSSVQQQEQDCLLQNTALTTSVCLMTDASGEQAVKLSQVAYERQDELENFDEFTNQVPVQAGLTYTYSVLQGEQEQNRAPAFPPSMDPSVGGLLECTDASQLYDPTIMQYTDTIAADQDCLLQNTALTTSVCLMTDSSGEQAVKLSQAAYERQDELENFDEFTNQVPVQAGLIYTYSVQQEEQGEQEQNRAPAFPPSMDPSVGGLLECTDASQLYDPTIMQYIDTIAADQECLWQSTGNTTLMGLRTDASEVNNPSHGNETSNLCDIFYELYSLISPQPETGSPGFYRSNSMLRSSQGEIEVQQECCYSSSSNVQASPSLFAENGAFPEDTHTIYNPDKLRIRNSRRWCKIRVQLKFLKTIKQTHCRPTKKQKT